MMTKEQRREVMKKARETKARKLKEKIEAALKSTTEPEQEVPLQAEVVVEHKPVPKKATTPWKPARVLDIPESMKDKRFTYRWVNTKKDGNDLKKAQEGWEFDRELSAKLTAMYGLNKTIEDGTPTGTLTHMRELVLMRMPKEMVQARNEYFQNRSKINVRSNKDELRSQIRNERGDERAMTYGSYNETQGE